MRRILSKGIAIFFGLIWFCALVGKSETIAYWKFDKVINNKTVDFASGFEDIIEGNFRIVKGVLGNAIKFDGFTTIIIREKEKTPKLSGDFTIEAWVALAAYPWNWCPIIAQENEGKEGYYFGIGPTGEVGLKMAINGKWVECVSKDRISLRKWYHLVATFSEKKGIKIFINGSLTSKLKVVGKLTPAIDENLVIGRNREKKVPSHPVRPFATLPAWFSLDGIIDELKIYDREISFEEVVAKYKSFKNVQPPDILIRKIPIGPLTPSRFGAYYTRLNYYEEWEALWRCGPYSDIVVQFDNSPIRVIFWRGTRYSPVWIMDKGLMLADQSAENFNRKEGCFEHMLDSKCFYSHVRIIENTPARIVIHWRYIPVSVYQHFSQKNELTGWPDVIDEYYTFYPDIIGIRKVVEWTSGRRLGPQETIILCNPGQKPEDVINLDALTLINLKGEAFTYSWENKVPKFKEGSPPNPVIQLINLKSEWKPFIIFEPGCRMKVFGIEHRRGVSHFPWWNHWPVAQIPSDGRYAQAPDRASHFSIAWGGPPMHKGPGPTYWGNWIYGAGRKSPKELSVLAKSWINPPSLTIKEKGLTFQGYDRGQRAYIITCDSEVLNNQVDIIVNANQESPVVNLCFVFKRGGDRKLKVSIDNRKLEQEKEYRIGTIRTLDGTDIILWIFKKSVEPFKITIFPVVEE